MPVPKTANHRIDAEVEQFLRDSLAKRLAALTEKQRAFFWSIWIHAPHKAQTVEALPLNVLKDCINLCDRTPQEQTS